MKFINLVTIAIVLTIHDVNGDEEKSIPPTKIAIIGGGIGGTSSSYFLRELFGDEVQIDLYEKNDRLCGRLATVNIGGLEYESGGSIIHPKNLHMVQFKEKFGLEEAGDVDGTLGIFDGSKFILQTSNWSILTFFKMVWTFGLNMLKLNCFVGDFMDKFVRIYELQSQGECFDDVTSLLHAVGGEEFVHATQISVQELFSSAGISNFTIDNIISPGIRANYGQNASANGFVGAVSMAGIQSGLWSIKGGNKLVCEKLVENSLANIIHEKVTDVKFNEESKNEKFSVGTEQRSENPRSYDIVIVAAPIENDMYHINVSCTDVKNCPRADDTGREFRKTVANFVQGKLNSSLFQCNSLKECPFDIMVPNQKTFYRSIGLHVPVDYDPSTGGLNTAYKIFSNEPLTDEQRDYLFESYADTATVEWKAYPIYNPPEKLTSFVLNKAGLYYTSPIEWSASAMEMSVISAKNAALLAHKNWFPKTSRKSGLTNGKIEL